jgi:hypothetical protein
MLAPSSPFKPCDFVGFCAPLDYHGGPGEAFICLTDDQLQAEVEYAIDQNPGWEKGTSNIYFLLTPEGVAVVAPLELEV